MSVPIRLRWRAAAGAVHLVIFALSLWVAYLLRFDFFIPQCERPLFYRGLLIVIFIKPAIFYLLRMDREQWWQHVGMSDLVRLGRANLAASFVFVATGYTWLGPSFPRSVYCLDLLLAFLGCAFLRSAVRLHKELKADRNHADSKGLLIYGAGEAGISLAREIRSNPSLGYKVLGFLDDDARKQHTTLIGLPVLGAGEDAGRVVDGFSSRTPRIEEIAVSMPSATGRQIRAAIARGKAAGVRCRVVPSLGDLLSGKMSVRAIKELSVTDLLGRDPVKLDLECVRRQVHGHTVLVTGAAGSIGSELCRQLAEFGPRRLVALDQAESELFRLEGELRPRYPELDLSAEIADIRDARRLEHVIEQHGVQAIFHAAAYKHVPLMEYEVYEAVRNNVLGTWNVAQTAARLGVQSLLLISSDKAVNPTSIMGLTKRIAELIVTAQRPANGTRPVKSVCVRFGNVLVSNGSVVPTFQKQIAAGGPVTVTHPDIERYFMTVQEAVALVLQASAMASSSEIYVLDMGKPVKIVDLARNMISLAGFVPNEDIEIRFVGLRPGEKLFEELCFEGENILPTNHEKINIFQGERLAFHTLVPWINELQHLLWREDTAQIVEHLRTLVPEYQGDRAEVTVLSRKVVPLGMRLVPAPAAASDLRRAVG
jgi:FlaA1/EpsC-like NDP-sugar epimerase